MITMNSWEYYYIVTLLHTHAELECGGSETPDDGGGGGRWWCTGGGSGGNIISMLILYISADRRTETVEHSRHCALEQTAQTYY